MSGAAPDKSALQGLHGAEKKEAFHRSCEKEIKSFSFRRPEAAPNDKKSTVMLALTDNENIRIQVVNEGGENNLHYHANMDSVYYVLKGTIRFYGPGNEIIGEYGVNDGLIMPAGARYWFEKIGEEEAHLFQVGVYPRGRQMAKRIDLEARKKNMMANPVIDGATGKLLPSGLSEQPVADG